ncbi:MAG: DUF2461 domain-containing protein [Bacteroidales bacterium]|nr:DUF2461 domain-containing protein [Bacteroidales bacterium]
MDSIISFLRALARNNNREWFNDHKKTYQEALELFRGFTGEVLTGIVRFDPSLGDLVAKDTIFRIYKDVRFSRDKTPYKTHFGCWMTRGGRKSTDAGYYFHLEPDNIFMAAGVYMPPKEQLSLIRQEIVFNPAAYLEMINDPGIKKGYERTGKDDMLKKGPAGFPKDFEFLEEIKYKHYIYSRKYSEPEIREKDFAQKLTTDFKGLFPLVNYLNHAMSFTGNE